jgi:hypothetical protein
MKVKTTLGISALLFGSALSAFALNNSATTAAPIRPDGSAVTEDFTAAGGPTAWFVTATVAGQSYVVEVESPFSGTPALGGRVNVALTNIADAALPSTTITACAPTSPYGSVRLAFMGDTSSDRGFVRIAISNTAGANFTFRVRVLETSLYCVRWSINGYRSFVDLQNTTDCAVQANVVLLSQFGFTLAVIPVSLNAKASTQIAITTAMTGGAIVGSAMVNHDGPKGAINGGIFQVNSLGGSSFLWPFNEARAYGSTSGS